MSNDLRPENISDLVHSLLDEKIKDDIKNRLTELWSSSQEEYNKFLLDLKENGNFLVLNKNDKDKVLLRGSRENCFEYWIDMLGKDINDLIVVEIKSKENEKFICGEPIIS